MKNEPSELVKSFGFPKVSKTLVGECAQLKIKHFGKKLIQSLKPLPFIAPRGPQGRSGKFYITGATGTLFVSYTIDLTGDEPEIELFYTKDATHIDGGHSQQIQLETQKLRFGTRWYFICECGKRRNILFLPPGANVFGCRDCHKLAYESSRINKKTMGGLLYYANRKLKLAQIRENIDRISYDGRPTKRMTRFFRMVENLENSIEDKTKMQLNQYTAHLCQ